MTSAPIRAKHLLILCAIAMLAPLPSQASDGAVSLDEWVRRGNRQLFAGDYELADETWDSLRRELPDHPAADVLAVSVLFWRQMHDEEDEQYDEAIEALTDRAIELGTAGLRRTPNDKDLHLYTGKAMMQQGRLRGIRGRYYSAGALGERARVHLERAMELDPSLVDARFQLGLYYYYAGFLPSLVKWLDFLWFVPTGNGEEGLEILNLVARDGDLERDHARFILGNIETYHREDLDRGYELIAGLHAEYPNNTLIHFELLESLEMQARYGELREAALKLEANPRGGPLHDGRKAMARVWRSRAETALGNAAHALDLLAPLVADEPDAPSWARAWVRLAHGGALEALGRRDEAVAQYVSVTNLEEPFHSSRASQRARAAIDESSMARAVGTSLPDQE